MVWWMYVHCSGASCKLVIIPIHAVQYAGIVEALRNGDMRLLRDSLQQHEDK